MYYMHKHAMSVVLYELSVHIAVEELLDGNWWLWSSGSSSSIDSYECPIDNSDNSSSEASIYTSCDTNDEECLKDNDGDKTLWSNRDDI